MTWVPTILAALASSLGCAPGAPVSGDEVAVLDLTLRRPTVGEGVLLNEKVVAYFSEDLDRSTVTPESVRILDPDGRRASGTLGVDGRELRFVPDPVYRADLSDGGFRPGTRYTVELRGFPDPAGLRAESGAPLRSSLRWSFTTVSAEDSARFEDETLERGGGLGLIVGTLLPEGPQSSLLLFCDEPLDPSTLRDEDFTLIHRGSGREHGLRARLIPPPTDRVPRQRLRGLEGAGYIELLPLTRLEPGQYLLDVDPELALRDYGGNPIWLSRPETWPQSVTVNAGDARPPGVYRESFLAPDRRSPVVPPAVGPWDGTAHWGRTGRVGLRFPLAAGDGSDGEVVLDASDSDDRRTDVQATSLSIPGEVTLSAPGLVVLRAQGRLRIDGKFARQPALADGARVPSMKDSFDGGALSDWLARAREADPPWLVLIAGGDLVIDGSYGFGVPVLCVAGGTVRITTRGESIPNELWVLGEGGASDPKVSVERAQLVIDEPVTNPLAVPLTVGVMSGPLPPRGRVVRWLSGQLEGHAGTGGYRVRYLRDGTERDPEALLVDDPRFLEDASAVRFVVELTMGPGVRWDPPFVDEVVVSWEEARR